MRANHQPLHDSYVAGLVRFLFRILYHQFAWLYNVVSKTISLGRWDDWIRTVLPYLKEGAILELGYGTGVLQSAMKDLDLVCYGIDESTQMGKLAKSRLDKVGHHHNLVTAAAQLLPFPDHSFNQVVTTFPSEFIVDVRVLGDVQRVLQNDGELIILPYAWIKGDQWYNRLTAWLFRITGQAPEQNVTLESPFEIFGFQVEVHQVELRSSTIPIFVAKKRIEETPVSIGIK